MSNTVDGRKKIPAETHQLRLVVEIPLLQGFIHRRWLFGISEPSTVFIVKLDHFTSSSAQGKNSTNIKKPRLSFPRSDLFPCFCFNFWIHIPGPSSWSKGTMVVHHAKASNLFLYIPFFSMRYESLNKNPFISLL